MNALFLDTGYLIALETADDQHHAEALRHWQTLTPSLPLLVTTSYVFSEVVTFFNSRKFHSKAVEVGTRLLNSPSVHLIYIDEALFRTGWEYFKQHADKSYSLTDCISFAIMQQRGIQTALAFDRHFAQAGFTPVP